MNYIKSMFVIENKTGCRFLTVDDNDPHTRLMYFDLMDLVG